MMNIQSFNGNFIQIQQFRMQILFDFQQLIQQLSTDQLIILNKEVGELMSKNPGCSVESQIFYDRVYLHIHLNQEHFYLYRPLLIMMQLSFDEVLSFQDIFPRLIPMQIMLLVRLMEIGNVTSFEYFELLSKYLKYQNVPIEREMDIECSPNVEQNEDIKIEILDQPPPKVVYKRNIKPPPTVSITGKVKKNTSNLYIVPVLIRCNNLEIETHNFKGNEPEKVISKKAYTFRKLKILVTSRQLDDTQFIIRFELRKYSKNMYDFTVIDQINSNPIMVYSHYTQLKTAPKKKPKVKDVVPSSGSPNGQTRVVILGNYFMDCPTTRVRFGDKEVIPIVHGLKTLICEAPKHPPGTVNVQVCLEPNQWGPSGTFTYDESVDIPKNGYEFNMDNVIIVSKKVNGHKSEDKTNHPILKSIIHMNS